MFALSPKWAQQYTSYVCNRVGQAQTFFNDGILFSDIIFASCLFFQMFVLNSYIRNQDVLHIMTSKLRPSKVILIILQLNRTCNSIVYSLKNGLTIDIRYLNCVPTLLLLCILFEGLPEITSGTMASCFLQGLLLLLDPRFEKCNDSQCYVALFWGIENGDWTPGMISSCTRYVCWRYQ